MFDGVSKRYPRGGDGSTYGSLRADLARIVRRNGSAKGRSALTDVSFEVPVGASMAIIGANGAGKSTALKIATRISYPTSGSVRVRGRVGALMEVGAGIHPELSGRENVWLYGSILGIARRELAEVFDDIVDFADLASAIDTQVKYYSSGMRVRLGFAIASALIPDILVVDEALAVGDAAFQQKCVQRMQGLVQNGRTLVFVSHSLPLVETLCTSAVLLADGRVAATGDAPEVIAKYRAGIERDSGISRVAEDLIALDGFEAQAPHSGGVSTGDTIELRVAVGCDNAVDDAVVGIGITDGRAGMLVSMTMLATGESVPLAAGHQTIVCSTGNVPLMPGEYEVWMSIAARKTTGYYFTPRAIGVLRVDRGPEGLVPTAAFGEANRPGPTFVPFTFRVDRG